MIRTIALDFPKTILIETTSLCQGECKFCPYAEVRKSNKVDLLTEEKYMDLLNEIKGHEITRLTLFNNNEPLLDKRIFKFIKIAHEMFPEVEIGISSNGRVVTREVLDKLKESGLTTLYMSIPCVDRENYKTVMGIYPDTIFETLENVDDEELFKMIRIAVPTTVYVDLEDIREKFSNYRVCYWNLEYKDSWGIKDKFMSVAPKDGFAGPCDRPMDQAVISANGDVIICCRDWQGQNVVGNVYENTLYEIWHGEKMQEIQNHIANGEYDMVECCKDCAMNMKVFKR